VSKAGFTLEGVAVGGGAAAQVLPEIGANHDGSREKLLQMVQAVAAAGARLVKFQFYTAEELVSDPDRVILVGSPGQTREETVGSMFGRLAVSRELMREAFAAARAAGLVPLATPFSEAGADFLAELGTPAFKVASSDVNHLPFLRHLAGFGKPILLSVGKATLAEVDEAVETLEEAGCRELALLHCVASYPSPMEDMNLRVIPSLAVTYPECVVGFSDHSLGLTASVAAAAMGASVVEKHVTLSRQDAGPDHWFSLEMDELSDLVVATRDVWLAMGSSRKRVLPSEAAGRVKGIRSLVTRRGLKAGEIIKPADLVILRPGGGIAPKHLVHVQGMKVGRDVAPGVPLCWEDFQDVSYARQKGRDL
jgi:N,N'-diacetyllegionaminate synthase